LSRLGGDEFSVSLGAQNKFNLGFVLGQRKRYHSSFIQRRVAHRNHLASYKGDARLTCKNYEK
jgi:hypothetical protein